MSTGLRRELVDVQPSHANERFDLNERSSQRGLHACRFDHQGSNLDTGSDLVTMVVSLGWHERTAPFCQGHVSKGGVGLLIILLEDTQNFGDVILSTRGQVMNSGRDVPSTLRLEVQQQVAVITSVK